jgi:four helix bundle protein
MESNLSGLLHDKAFGFGVESYRICNAIMKSKNEWILTRQLIRSATAVGALIAESDHAQSKLDFINKRSIARKECNESAYWIAMMLQLGIMEQSNAQSLSKQADELMRILTSGIKTAKRNLEHSKTTSKAPRT